MGSYAVGPLSTDQDDAEREDTVRAVARLDKEITTHEAVCAERWRQILDRMARMEAVVIWSAGVLVCGMGGIIWTLLSSRLHP
jgi:hypothetical protein